MAFESDFFGAEAAGALLLLAPEGVLDVLSPQADSPTASIIIRKTLQILEKIVGFMSWSLKLVGEKGGWRKNRRKARVVRMRAMGSIMAIHWMQNGTGLAPKIKFIFRIILQPFTLSWKRKEIEET